MVDRAEITRINNMTFHELRNELAYCGNNKVKEDLIRHIMYQRYKKHLETKNKMEQIKFQKKQKYLEKLKRQQEREIKKKLSMEKKRERKVHQQEEKEDDNLSFDSSDFQETNRIIVPSNGFDDFETNEVFDKRDITEYDRDITNNNLVNRLNNDIDIRNSRNRNKRVPNKIDFVPPYANNSGDNYASFDSILTSSKKDFSNVKLKKK